MYLYLSIVKRNYHVNYDRCMVSNTSVNFLMYETATARFINDLKMNESGK